MYTCVQLDLYLYCTKAFRFNWEFILFCSVHFILKKKPLSHIFVISYPWNNKMLMHLESRINSRTLYLNNAVFVYGFVQAE